MKNFIILLTFSLCVFSDGFCMGSRKPTTPTPPPKPDETLPAFTGIKFAPVKNYTSEELEVLAIAESLANQLVKSACFANFMMNRGLIDTNGKQPIEVINHLANLTLNVPVTMYYKFNNVVGYRNVGSPIVYTNRRFHAGATACSRASNLTHEWSHVAGYSHDYNATRSRPLSVPYSINAAMEKCCTCQGIKNCVVMP